MAMLYFNNSSDRIWDTVENWFNDEALQSPAGCIPATGDSVHILNTFVTGPSTSVNLYMVRVGYENGSNTFNFDADNIQAGLFEFFGGTVNNNSSTLFTFCFDADAPGVSRFRGNSMNYGTIPSNAEFYDSACNYGYCNGVTVFNDISYNRGYVMSATFNDASYNAPDYYAYIQYTAEFNDVSINYGNGGGNVSNNYIVNTPAIVNGMATFNGGSQNTGLLLGNFNVQQGKIAACTGHVRWYNAGGLYGFGAECLASPTFQIIPAGSDILGAGML